MCEKVMEIKLVKGPKGSKPEPEPSKVPKVVLTSVLVGFVVIQNKDQTLEQNQTSHITCCHTPSASQHHCVHLSTLRACPPLLLIQVWALASLVVSETSTSLATTAST